MKALLASLLLSTIAHALPVTFLAVGRPSMLKIRGECHGEILSRAPFEAVVKLESCKTGISLRDKHMKEKYLEVKVYPDATLRGQMPEAGAFKGKLTVHGKEADVVGEVKDGVLSFSTTISAHGIEIPQFMGVTVADKVEIEAEIKGVQ